uniref:G-protein coupled receptors family 1 profile domain-containing protein n=1 Tax=Pygocentrus nattereri TaxID=42514 RepID=A0AAR2LQC8_PYGNA
MHTFPVQKLQAIMNIKITLTVFLMIECLLGLSSNLTVLVLYCMKLNLVSSVSIIVTMNLHILDALVCVGCIPFTTVVILLPLKDNNALFSCFHEACISFTSVATATNVLAITLDRYDISARTANRVLTMGRAVALLGFIWALSFLSFLVPFIEVAFFNQEVSVQNQTVEVDNTTIQYYTEPGLYYHLLAQIPIFCFTSIIMLVTYYKILQALNIHIVTCFQTTPKKRTSEKKPISMTETLACESTDIQSGGRTNPPLAMCTSVSVIIALRRAVKRHKERRKQQKRAVRTSLLIISTFLLCWTPITLLNIILLCVGPSNFIMRLRLGFLVMAYGTTFFHPLLYAFTRPKFQKKRKRKKNTFEDTNKRFKCFSQC